jgi:hypothetical protein
MIPKLTSEQRSALQSSGSPFYIEDDQAHKLYVLVPQAEYRRLLGEELDREIQIGIDQADRGELEEWDVEAVIAEAERRFAAKQRP